MKGRIKKKYIFKKNKRHRETDKNGQQKKGQKGIK